MFAFGPDNGARLAPSPPRQEFAPAQTKRRPGVIRTADRTSQVVPTALVLAGAGQFAQANIRFLSGRAFRLGQLLPELLGIGRLAGDHQASGL